MQVKRRKQGMGWTFLVSAGNTNRRDGRLASTPISQAEVVGVAEIDPK